MSAYATPPPLDLPSLAHTLAFHPSASSPVLTAGCVDGRLRLISLASAATVVHTTDVLLDMVDPHHAASAGGSSGSGSSFHTVAARAARSVRTVAHLRSGDGIVVGLASGSLLRVDAETCVPVWAVQASTSSGLPRRWRADPAAAAEAARGAAVPSGDGEGVAAALAAARAVVAKKGYGRGGGGGGGTGAGASGADEGEVEAVNAVVVVGDHAIATGDDRGQIRIWDVRTPNYVRSIDMHEDFVSDFVVVSDGSVLISSSGDGRIGAFDLAANKPISESEAVDFDLVNVDVVASGGLVVAASESGELEMFETGLFGAPLDRFSCQPSIDAMLAISPHAVATAAPDGTVRIVSIQPNKLVEVVAEHGIEVSALALSPEALFLASAGHDNVVRFTNLTSTHQRVADLHSSGGAGPSAGAIFDQRRRDADTFFDDLAGDDE